MSAAAIDYDALARQSGAVGATPAQTPPAQPAAPSGGVDLDALARQSGAVGATPAQTPTQTPPPQPQSMGGQIWQSLKETDPSVGLISGALKEAQKHLAGAIDLADKYVVQPTTGAPVATAAVHHAAQETADWLRKNTSQDTLLEKVGGYGESAAELLAPEMWGGKAVEGMSYADRLLEMGKNAKLIEKNPGLLPVLKAGISALKTGVESAKTGAMTGTQSFVESGGDVDKAEQDALLGAGTTAVLGAGTKAVGAVAEALRPGTESLEGVTMPVAAEQSPKPSILTKLANRPEDIPAVENTRQAAAPQIVENSAQRALRNGLNEVNQTRGQMQGPADEFGVGPDAFKFTVAPHGEPIQTTDPNFVHKLLSEAQDLKESDAFDQMSPRQQTRTDSTIDDLTQQLDQYHQELATRPRFTPVDVDAALKQGTDFRTAGNIMQDSVDDIYQRMRGAANEQLDKKWLKQLQPSEFDALMEQNADKFTPADRQAATDAFRKGVVLKKWGSAIQQGFNVSAEDAAATSDIGGERTFTGSNKISNDIDKVIADHGDDLRSMVGDQGINSMRRLNYLMKGQETSGPLQQILRGTASVLRRHYGDTAGFIGHVAAPFLGVSHLTGIGGGVAAGYALKKVVNSMAASPAIADRIAYAVENKVGSRIAAPLIASMMIRATAPEEPQQQPPPPGAQ